MADSVKTYGWNVSTNVEFRIEANSFGMWGGIFSVGASYSFVGQTPGVVLVDLVTRFGEWDFTLNGLEKRLPWVGGGGQCVNGGLLTMASTCLPNTWGTLVSNQANYRVAPWIPYPPEASNPSLILYWLRESKPGFFGLVCCVVNRFG
jgi:hypothetical protein